MIYKLIADSDTPISLLSLLADRLNPLSYDNIYDNRVYKSIDEGTVDEMEDDVFKNYLHFFKPTFYSE